MEFIEYRKGESKLKIINVTSQNRRDFHAEYVCEGCGAIENKSGYDDRNFHDNVVPNMKCKQCEKSRNDLGIIVEAVETRYPEGYQI